MERRFPYKERHVPYMERRIPWMERGTANPENVLSMDNLAQEQDRPLFYTLRRGALASVVTIFSRPLNCRKQAQFRRFSACFRPQNESSAGGMKRHGRWIFATPPALRLGEALGARL
jgi:hypothetical protein